MQKGFISLGQGTQETPQGEGRHGGWGGISDGYRDLNKQRHRTGKSQSHWGPEMSAFYMGIRKGLLGTAGPASPAGVGKCA